MSNDARIRHKSQANAFKIGQGEKERVANWLMRTAASTASDYKGGTEVELLGDHRWQVAVAPWLQQQTCNDNRLQAVSTRSDAVETTSYLWVVICGASSAGGVVNPG